MLAEQMIAFSKYIKPPHLQAENQRVAHVTFRFNHHKGANHTIQDGMFIESKHVNVRKMLTEPRRCLKCQKYRHYTVACKEKEDTCARCVEHHRALTCTITDTARFKCSNCIGETAKEHGAADRECAKFEAERKKNQSHVPENKYKYYPTSSLDSWRLLNETDSHREGQQQRPQHSRRQNTQFMDILHQQQFFMRIQVEDDQHQQEEHGEPPQVQMGWGD